MSQTWDGSVGKHWVAFLVQGIIMVVLGVLALAAPMLASLAAEVFVGWLFIISGIVGLFGTFSAWRVQGSIWHVVTAVLAILVGLLLVWRPIEGLLSLTMLLALFFLLEGVAQIVLSIAHRSVLPRAWGWMLASGIADLVLAAVIIAGWPATAAWALGVLVGVNLITSGWAFVMAALAARRPA